VRLPLYVLAVSGGALVQCTVIPMVGVGGIVPDVPIVLTVLLALRYGAEAGCLTGFALGLAQDAVAGGPLGLHALSKALLGFAAGDLPRWVLVTRPIVPVGLAVLATIVDGLVRFGLLQLFHYPAPLGEIFTRVIVPQAGYNGILAAVALVLPAGRLLSRG
jgi:rod shape-determining protein MreD